MSSTAGAGDVHNNGGTAGPTNNKRRTCTKGGIRKNTTLDGVIVEEPFTFEGGNIGEGCYVSCTVHNRKRYYGVLVDQDALKTASQLFLKNEADSLDLNRRIKQLYNQQQRTQENQQQLQNNDHAIMIMGKKCVVPSFNNNDNRQVQKFLFLPPPEKENGPGYRTLLATYANVRAAAEEDDDKSILIWSACENGGNFVGNYYYQFFVEDSNFLTATPSLETAQTNTDIMLRTSVNLGSFFHTTLLPPWYPLSNMNGFPQNKVLSVLKLKKKNKENGELEFEDDASEDEMRVSSSFASRKTILESSSTNTADVAIPNTTNHTKIRNRRGYRIGVLGGGIAGLACASELLRLAEATTTTNDKDSNNNDEDTDTSIIQNIQVVLLEGRDRVGGRLYTDYETFGIPVDLGGGWIHGTEGNPLTDLAREAGATLVPTSEDPKMLSSSMQEADEDTDQRMEDLFNRLLDQGADYSWHENEIKEVKEDERRQTVVRWYGSALSSEVAGGKCHLKNEQKKPIPTDVPMHRHSTDISVDHALGLTSTSKDTCGTLTTEELRLLHWHTKNTEYALGADINSLSMKYWDSDDDHAFKGEAVLVKEGYGKIIDLLLQRCQRRKNFELLLNFRIGRIEYANTTKDGKAAFPVTSTSAQKKRKYKRTLEFVPPTNTCSVTSQDGRSSLEFDFLVCTLPLGVLKSSIDAPSSKNAARTPTAGEGIVFNPALPMTKRDAINAVGFGALSKIYLKFPNTFWRSEGSKESLRSTPFLGDSQESFGNVSGVNPQYYIFYDVGKILNNDDDEEPPAILLTWVSGCEAVRIEQLSDEAVTKEVMVTLKSIYTSIDVPQPVLVKITRWGCDEFARGCYSFLPPGSTNEDYNMLQLPINGNGDKFSERNLETMRLFWAGEHTASLHPSVSHGALLSGIRAAEQVFNEMHMKTQNGVSAYDSTIPATIYRSRRPFEPLRCALCNKIGSRDQEGSLMAFQKGVKQALVHVHCALYSPEVEFFDDNWKNVLKAVSRGRLIKCSKCQLPGASIGCNLNSCLLSYHFSCCEDEDWTFERDGKVFFCKQHRNNAKKLRRSLVPAEAIQHDLIGSASDTA